MPWFDNKKETEAAKELLGAIPEAYKNKTPAELKVILEKAEKDGNRIAVLEAEREEERKQVTNIQTQFDGIKAKLTSIEANSAPKPTPENNENRNFIDDPEGAFNDRAKPIAALAVTSAAMTAKMLAQQELDNRDMNNGNKTHDGRLFRAWGQEIQAKASSMNQTALVYPNTWLEIYYTVKGIHADELRDPETRKKNYTFMEPASTAAPAKVDDTKPANEQLSPQELRVAERMGVTPENYLKRKKAMTFVGA